MYKTKLPQDGCLRQIVFGHEKSSQQTAFAISEKFLDLCCLTNAVMNIEQLRTADFTAACDNDVNYVRGMDRESLFYADTVCNVSDCEALGYTAVLLGNYKTFKELNSLLRTLFDFVVNNNRITYVECRKLGFKLLAYKRLKLIQCDIPPFEI